jgi:eukaryotic-like serine/threonine-protein kinase
MPDPDGLGESASVEELTMSEIELTRALDAPAPGPSAPRAPAPVRASSPTAAESSVGRYELLLEIASGGMATVYIGRQRGAGGFERLVAIKRMHPHIGAVPALAASFMDEARIASLIRHPNVVNVHDVHDADGEHLLIMDYVDGPSLATVSRAARKRSERISRPAVIRVLVDSLYGLHAAHELTNLDGIPLGVVHRDATPHNILLGVDGGVKITDFGIAKAAERTVHTATGMAKGKFRYMAPEQARGGAIDRRVDVFAMGVVAWELLTGERLFKGEGDAQILLEITDGRYRRPSSIASDVPEALEKIVMRALAPNPNDRWPTALAYAEALEAFGRLHSELVSNVEVARLVHEFCGAAIVERRKILSSVLHGSRPPAAFPAARQTQGSGTGSSAGTSAPLTVDSVKVLPALTPLQIAEHRRRKQLLLIAAGSSVALALALLLVLGLTVASRRSAPAEASDPVEVRAPVSAPALAPALPAKVRVVVTADSEVSEVSGPGVTGVTFKDKSAEFELLRSDSPVTLLVRLSDGSQISETVTPNDNTAIRVRSVAGATVRLNDLPKAPPKPAPVVGGQKPAGDKPAPGLEKNPYE